jgi:hypothetical protein
MGSCHDSRSHQLTPLESSSKLLVCHDLFIQELFVTLLQEFLFGILLTKLSYDYHKHQLMALS